MMSAAPSAMPILYSMPDIFLFMIAMTNGREMWEEEGCFAMCSLLCGCEGSRKGGHRQVK